MSLKGKIAYIPEKYIKIQATWKQSNRNKQDITWIQKIGPS